MRLSRVIHGMIPALAALITLLPTAEWCAADDQPPAHSTQPAVPAAPQLAQQSTQPAQVDGGLFWMVNSICAAQHKRQQHSGPLLYHRRVGDGWQTGTDAEFQGHFVPGVPVAIVVHGSFVEWRTQSLYADATNRWIRNAAPGRPLHVVFYNWPSGSPYTNLFHVDVAVRGCRAEFNAFHLAHVITLIPEESPVCLIGHSHGARTALATLHLASGGEVQDLVFTGRMGTSRRMRAILAAAAVDHNWLNPGEQYDHALFAADVVNFKNRRDLPLNFYPLIRPFGRPTLATTGFTDGDRQELGPLGWRAIDVDVTELVQEAHTWPNYLRSRAIAAEMARYLYFDDERGPAAAGDGRQMSALPTIPWQEQDD